MSELKHKQLISKLGREVKNQKYIDIFLHLKNNMQNNTYNCKCETNDRYYCIPCKMTCCSLCNYKAHQPHILIRMKDNQLETGNLNRIFKNFSNNIKKSRLISDTAQLKKEIYNDIDLFVDDIIKKLSSFRKNKKDILDKLFDKLELNIKLMDKNLENLKSSLVNFTNKNQKFFNLEQNSPEGNKDLNNTYFLLGYDMINITNQGMNEIYRKVGTIEEDLQNYLDEQYDNFSRMGKSIEKLLQTEEVFTDNRSTDENSKTISKKDKKEDDTIQMDLNSPIGHFMYTINELGEEYFKQVDERINIYNKHIDNFKKIIYNTLNTNGNLKEIEINLKSIEQRKLTGAESLFSGRDGAKNASADSSFDQSYFNLRKSINSDKDVCLNHSVINKYFGYLFIDLYDKYFKVISKELQSSHADLLIKINEDEELNDIGKIIECTNEIQFYEKKSKKIYKIHVNLTKNPFGYTKFPIGCRSLLLGDKLYITGGRDEYNEYANVLIFDRRTNAIKRIMDLRIPRAYHTMIYSDTFNSLMVFGGENESSVEIFDPLTNRWQLLPEMKIPRANILYYCDNPRGIIYTMFGNEGCILDNKYSDIIEFLDLKNIKEGWNVLDYRNKSGVDLKTLMNIIPLNPDLILLYGGVVCRGHTRSICVFNIIKSEITEVDNKILEKLRVEAKKSKKLSAIISGLSTNGQSKMISGSNFKMKIDNLKG